MTNVIPPEWGITNVTRLMIEAAPAPEVPEGYRDCIVVGPQDMWNGMLGIHWSVRYPFQGDERPTWAQFMEAMRLVIAEETNACLSTAEAAVARVEQQAMAQIAVISEANRYMSREMQSCPIGSRNSQEKPLILWTLIPKLSRLFIRSSQPCPLSQTPSR